MASNKRGERGSRFKISYIERAALACQVGMTDYELAKLFGVSESTINNWKEKYPEFAEALTAGKSFADERVVRSLYHRAIGYTYDTEEVFLRSRPQKKDKNGKVIRQAGT